MFHVFFLNRMGRGDGPIDGAGLMTVLSADKCHSLSQIKNAHYCCNPCSAAKLVFPSLPWTEWAESGTGREWASLARPDLTELPGPVCVWGGLNASLISSTSLRQESLREICFRNLLCWCLQKEKMHHVQDVWWELMLLCKLIIRSSKYSKD